MRAIALVSRFTASRCALIEAGAPSGQTRGSSTRPRGEGQPFGGLGGFPGLSGFGFGPFGFFSDGGFGVGEGAVTPGSGVAVGVGVGGGVAGAGFGVGFGFGFAGCFGSGVDLVLDPVGFAAALGLAGAGVARTGSGVAATSAASTRGPVGSTTVTAKSTTRAGSVPARAVATTPPSGTEGAGAGGVATRPRRPPSAHS